ncbi:MAG: hypothetical protein KGI33_11225 [Thaumarchaeota archaeon]|nr:hypothetical protein [Nitrososphaerota archaeon]
MSGNKTSTFTFRIDSEYERILRQEAHEKKVTVNALANKIFGDYVEWHRYMERFGTIVLSRNAFKTILDALDEKSLVRLAADVGEKAPREFILFKWKVLAADNVVKFIKMYFDHCGYGAHDESRTGGTVTFSIHHDLGQKGSVFLKTFLETMIKSTLGRSCNSTVTESSLVLVFRE